MGIVSNALDVATKSKVLFNLNVKLVMSLVVEMVLNPRPRKVAAQLVKLTC